MGESCPTEELLTGVRALLDAGTEYYTAVQTIIPIAATNEVVFTRFYDLAIRRPGDPAATILLLGYDSLPILAEKSLFDLARWAQQHPNVREWLQDTAVDQIVARLDQPSGDEASEFDELARKFAEHLERYGHTVYNLDFLNAVPADDPAPLVDTLKLYLRGEGSDPYERQQRSVQRREEATAKINRRLDPVRRAVFGRLLQRAQSVAPLREDALADVGLAWPVLRRLLLELGRRLQTASSLQRPDDVFWCTTTEIAAHLSEPMGHDPGELAEAVERRKEIWRGQRRVTPPQMLPQRTWLHLLDTMMPATATEQTGDVLQGIGASGGRVTAVARVLRGPEDFAGLGVGEVLVASITTPAWTPLFARAAAVVTDIGGPLSHSSIVAREYGIPAVLGTGVATRRIEDGQRITVDGDRGRVWLGPGSPDEDEQAPSTGDDRRRRVAVALAVACRGILGRALLVPPAPPTPTPLRCADPSLPQRHAAESAEEVTGRAFGGRRSPVLLELDLTERPASAEGDDPVSRLQLRGRRPLRPILRALHEAGADRQRGRPDRQDRRSAVDPGAGAAARGAGLREERQTDGRVGGNARGEFPGPGRLRAGHRVRRDLAPAHRLAGRPRRRDRDDVPARDAGQARDRTAAGAAPRVQERGGSPDPHRVHPRAPGVPGTARRLDLRRCRHGHRGGSRARTRPGPDDHRHRPAPGPRRPASSGWSTSWATATRCTRPSGTGPRPRRRCCSPTVGSHDSGCARRRVAEGTWRW